MKYCEICRKPETEVGPFESIVKDFILITERECCEKCRATYEGKPGTPYEFYYKGEEDELGGFRFGTISKNGDDVPTPTEAV